MMKNEFEELLGQTVTSEQYEVIETVYMFHPVIDDVKGKQQIVEFWKLGLVQDMHQRACIIRDMTGNQYTLRTKYQETKKEQEAEIAKITKMYDEKLYLLQLEMDRMVDMIEVFKGTEITLKETCKTCKHFSQCLADVSAKGIYDVQALRCSAYEKA